MVARDAEARFLGLVDDLLVAAQRAGAARSGVTVPEVKAFIAGAQTMLGYGPHVAERVTGILPDGLRPRQRSGRRETPTRAFPL